MDRIETRLRDAAEETRERMRHAVPEPPGPRRSGAAGWLVLATAFAAVILLFAVPVLLGGEAAPQADPISRPPTTIVEVTPTTAPENPVVCSSSDVPEPEPDPDLPPAVSAKALAIIRFASNCDFDGLAGIASPGFVTSFGGGGIENLRQWEEEGRGELGTLLELFGTSPAVLEGEHDPKIYVWPAALVYEDWEDIPEEYLAELSAIYSQEQLDEISGFGSYAGWRTGIDEFGNWLYFTGGD